VLSKKVCALLYQVMSNWSYAHIARYDDTYDPRAFGDRLTGWGTPVVLIESGWPSGQGDAFLVQLNFTGLLAALQALADGSIQQANAAAYDVLLENNGGRVMDWIRRGVTILSGNSILPFSADVGINFNPVYDDQKNRRMVGRIADLGDLSVFAGHREIAAADWVISPSDLANGKPQGEVLPGSGSLFVYRRRQPGQSLELGNLIPVGVLRGGEWRDAK
jgi:hypothetical protein